jgi:hypothetical protein
VGLWRRGRRCPGLHRLRNRKSGRAHPDVQRKSDLAQAPATRTIRSGCGLHRMRTNSLMTACRCAIAARLAAGLTIFFERSLRRAAVSSICSAGSFFFAFAARPAECRIEGVVAHWATERIRGWEHILTQLDHGMQFAKDDESLARQWYAVRSLHLHGLGRHRPNRLLEISLLSPRRSQLAGPTRVRRRIGASVIRR